MTSSDNQLDERQQKFLKTSVHDRHQVMFTKTFLGTASPRMAIKAYCLDCCGNDVESATNCTVTVCPLWRYNGYRLGYRMGRSSPSEKELSDGAPEHDD